MTYAKLHGESAGMDQDIGPGKGERVSRRGGGGRVKQRRTVTPMVSPAVLCPSVSLSDSAHSVFCAPASKAVPHPLPHHSFAPLRASAAPFHPITDKEDGLSLKCLHLKKSRYPSYECVNNGKGGGVAGVYS